MLIICIYALGLQRSYVVKDIRKRLNSEVDVVHVENGAYRPFKKTLSAFLTHIVSLFTRDILHVYTCNFKFFWFFSRLN